jgi:predicted transcriptional regulator YheO
LIFESDVVSAIQSYIPICRALAKLLPDLVEVVLHDFESNAIAHIENAFTPRKAGDPSLLETANYAYELDVDKTIGPYKKSNPDGSKLKSVSSLIEDENGKPIGLLCINMRVEALELVMQLCEGLVKIDHGDDAPIILHNDWRETSNTIIAEVLKERGVSVTQARREDRFAIVKRLHHSDIFSARGAANYVAEALGVSRAGFYQLLRAVRTSKVSQSTEGQ